MNVFAQKFTRRSEFALPWAARTGLAPRRPQAERVRHPFDLVGRLGWKRAVDILLSMVGVIVTSPVMGLVAVLITMTSPGPVFYRQERIGINRRTRERRGSLPRSEAERRRRDRRVLVNFGRPFTIYKFRTMVVDAERGTPPMWAKERDPRITGVGRVLRKARIDELPQFWNVLRGDMSIVGPRPERAYFIGRIEKELPEFQLRLRTKPGITGLAQVQLGYTNTDDGLRDKLHLDLEYIRRVSLWTDLKILGRTVFVVFTGKGAC